MRFFSFIYFFFKFVIYRLDNVPKEQRHDWLLPNSTIPVFLIMFTCSAWLLATTSII